MQNKLEGGQVQRPLVSLRIRQNRESGSFVSTSDQRFSMSILTGNLICSTTAISSLLGAAEKERTLGTAVCKRSHNGSFEIEHRSSVQQPSSWNPQVLHCSVVQYLAPQTHSTSHDVDKSKNTILLVFCLCTVFKAAIVNIFKQVSINSLVTRCVVIVIFTWARTWHGRVCALKGQLRINSHWSCLPHSLPLIGWQKTREKRTITTTATKCVRELS